jgi:hypothetical protein
MTSELTMEERLDRLATFRSEGRLVRNKWGGNDDSGREVACLLAALSPEVLAAESPYECPASVMPKWFAKLTPWIDDTGSVEKWPSVIERYANLARRWRVLSDETWNRLDYSVQAICVREAMRRTTNPRSIEACTDVVALCDRAACGDTPTREEWRKAEAAANDAANAAYAYAANAAAVAAAYAAANVAYAAAAAAYAAANAAYAAAAAAADRIIDAVLTTIEKACDEVERAA